MEQQPPVKLTAGRGGRGAAILAALQAAQRQPGQATQPSSAVPSPPQVGSGGVTPLQPDTGATAASAAAPAPTPGRGLLISRLLMAQKNQQLSSSSGSLPMPGGGATGASSPSSLSSSTALPSRGRGRAEIFRAMQVGSDTTKPGGLPRKSCSQESGTPSGEGTSSLPEGMEKLNISEEKDVVIRHGEIGNKFPASANWIRLSLEPNKAVFEYEVKFDPQVDALNLRFKLLNSQMDKLGNTKSFDGAKLWLPIHLPKEVTVLQTTNPITGVNVTVKVIFRKKTSMDKSIQLYNVLFNRIMKVLKMARVGFSWYAPQGSVLVPQHKLEIWPGYVTAAQYQEDGVMLCCDVSHRVLRTQTIYDLLADICREKRGPFNDAAVKAVVGSCVLTRYNNKAYRIDDILFDQNASSTFTDHKGAEISYIQYYKDAYNIKIKDPQQPLLLHKVKKKELREQGTTKILCLIPELCYMTGLTDEMRSDFRVMKDLAQHTRVTPTVRQASLRSFIKNVNESVEAKKILSDWGLSLNDDTIQLEGRILPHESIFFNEKSIPGTDKADWGREATREKVITAVDLKPKCWMVLFTQRDEPRANSFVQMMRQVLKSAGFQVPNKNIVYTFSDYTILMFDSSFERPYGEFISVTIALPFTAENFDAVRNKKVSVTQFLSTELLINRLIDQPNSPLSVGQKI
ncbi:unnamed protein product, partial [Meganyctiphanes norvegica]